MATKHKQVLVAADNPISAGRNGRAENRVVVGITADACGQNGRVYHFGVTACLMSCRGGIGRWHPRFENKCLLKFGKNWLAGDQCFRGKDLLIQRGTRAT